MKSIIGIIFFCFVISPSFAGESKLKPRENEVWIKIVDWIVMFDAKQKAGLAYRLEKNEPNSNPQLDISCYLPTHDGKGFRMTLLRTGGFKTKDPLSVDVMVSTDDNPPLGDKWFPEENRLWSSKPRMLIKDMIDANEFHMRFRDERGLNDYTYELDGLGKVISTLEQVCGYKFDGSKL